MLPWAAVGLYTQEFSNASLHSLNFHPHLPIHDLTNKVYHIYQTSMTKNPNSSLCSEITLVFPRLPNPLLPTYSNGFLYCYDVKTRLTCKITTDLHWPRYSTHLVRYGGIKKWRKGLKHSLQLPVACKREIHTVTVEWVLWCLHKRTMKLIHVYTSLHLHLWKVCT